MASLLVVRKRECARAAVRCSLGVTTAGVNRMAKSKEWAKPAAIGKLSRNERPVNHGI